jgi:hypothetical protein
MRGIAGDLCMRFRLKFRMLLVLKLVCCVMCSGSIVYEVLQQGLVAEDVWREGTAACFNGLEFLTGAKRTQPQLTCARVRELTTRSEGCSHEANQKTRYRDGVWRGIVNWWFGP